MIELKNLIPVSGSIRESEKILLDIPFVDMTSHANSGSKIKKSKFLRISIGFLSTGVGILLITWGIYLKEIRKEQDLELFNKYASDQDKIHFKKLQKLIAEKDEMQGNILYDDLVGEYKKLYKRSVQRIKKDVQK